MTLKTFVICFSFLTAIFREARPRVVDIPSFVINPNDQKGERSWKFQIDVLLKTPPVFNRVVALFFLYSFYVFICIYISERIR